MPESTLEKKKTPKACDVCRARKVKCDGREPCSKCIKNQQECTYNYRFKERVRRKGTNSINMDPQPKRKRGRPKKNQSIDMPNKSASLDDIFIPSTSATPFLPAATSTTMVQTPSTIVHTPSSMPAPPVPPIINPTSLSTCMPHPSPPLIQSNNNESHDSHLNESNSRLFSNVSPGAISHTYNMNPSQSTAPRQPTMEDRLSKLESMLHSLLERINPASSPSNSNNLLNYGKSDSYTPQNAFNNGAEKETETSMWNGLFLHTAVFFLSKVGLMVLEKRMERPEVLKPLKLVLQLYSPFEKKLLSKWTTPILSEFLTPLPSRNDIECLMQFLKMRIFYHKTIDLEYLDYLYKCYCDCRDGLIPEPNFSYSDYFFMNSCLLTASLYALEIREFKFNITMQFPSIDLRTLVEKLRDNALFYYNKTLIISGGLNSITSCLLLAEYADFTSSSRAAYTISNTAIRHAQDLGLHLENTYRGLNPKEKVLRLNVWWACYAIDKEMCIRWGQPPVLSDRDISAPPLSGFEPFWSSNVSSKKRSKRFVHGLEIKSTLESLSGNMYDITVMEQFVTTDYALLISKIHSSFLQANSLKHLSNKDVSLLKDSLLNELECWRNNIPEELRPKSDSDEDYTKFFKYINQLRESTDLLSAFKMIFCTICFVRYHHVKNVIFHSYINYYYVNHDDEIMCHKSLKEITASSRAILKIACYVDTSCASYSNYFVFYPFNAFLTICGYYIHLDEKPLKNVIESDLQLLSDCIKYHVLPYIETFRISENGRIIEYVFKCMLYATYETCLTRFGDLDFSIEGLDVFQEIPKLAEDENSLKSLITESGTVKEDERPFVKMPYFERPKFQTLNDRTPSVPFLLSPNCPKAIPGFKDPIVDNDGDGVFYDMMNIPNYFLDYIDRYPTTPNFQ